MTDLDLARWREGHTAAATASERLRAVLAELGVPERSYRSIRPATTSTGRPYVYLGIVSAEAVETITTALQHQLEHSRRQEEQRHVPISHLAAPEVEVHLSS